MNGGVSRTGLDALLREQLSMSAVIYDNPDVMTHVGTAAGTYELWKILDGLTTPNEVWWVDGDTVHIDSRDRYTSTFFRK